MDEQFVVPGTNIRFGWDTILGLFPGIGDALTSAISLLIVHHTLGRQELRLSCWLE